MRLSAWNNAFYDALQARKLDEFWRQVGVFGLLAAAYIAIAVVRLVMQQRLVMRWRTSLTDQLLGAWLAPGNRVEVLMNGDGTMRRRLWPTAIGPRSDQ